MSENDVQQDDVAPQLQQENDTQISLADNIREWLKIDTEMKALQAEIKKRRERKKVLSVLLVDVLRSSGIDGWDTNEGKLEYHKQKTRSTVNKEHIKTALKKFIEDEEQIHAMTEYIYDSRQVKEKEVIKRK